MNQSQFLAITRNLLEAREKSRVHGAVGFGLILIDWKTACNYFWQSFENCSNSDLPNTFFKVRSR